MVKLIPADNTLFVITVKLSLVNLGGENFIQYILM